MPFDGDRFACNPLSVAKLDRVIALIDTPEKWCQGSVVDYDGRMCIVGAISSLGRDSVAPLGLFGPVVHAIAEITGRAMPIEAFNDHPCTTHKLVMKVLRRTRENLLAGVTASGARTCPSARGCWRCASSWAGYERSQLRGTCRDRAAGSHDRPARPGPLPRRHLPRSQLLEMQGRGTAVRQRQSAELREPPCPK